jgi:hypothetical protein
LITIEHGCSLLSSVWPVIIFLIFRFNSRRKEKSKQVKPKDKEPCEFNTVYITLCSPKEVFSKGENVGFEVTQPNRNDCQMLPPTTFQKFAKKTYI